jgi:putative DNA primase/helicase
VSPKIGADDHIASGGTIENLPRAEPPAPHCTDLGNSERFVRQHGPDLRYVYQWRAFMHWTGRLWERDRGDGVRERAKETARSIYAEAAAVRDDVQRHALARWAVTSESAHAQQNMVLMAQSAIALPAERFDTHPWLLNLENGTLDLSTGELRPHRRDDLLTKMCPTPYDLHGRYRPDRLGEEVARHGAGGAGARAGPADLLGCRRQRQDHAREDGNEGAR